MGQGLQWHLNLESSSHVLSLTSVLAAILNAQDAELHRCTLARNASHANPAWMRLSRNARSHHL